jgi:hypothetical protein
LLNKVEFFKLQRQDRKTKKDLEKNFEELSKIVINSKSTKFFLLITDIFEAWEALNSDSKSEKTYGIMN